jgi:hypothetical protein
MLYIKVSLIAVFAVAAVHAARYCRCENPQYGRFFPGIQSVCTRLSKDWCATNCNLFGKNCDYCEYTPAGPPPDADFAALKEWCFAQRGHDSITQRSYLGSVVNCYSFENIASCGTCGGCSYSKTSFFKRLAVRQDDGQGSDPDPNLAPDANAVLQ